MTTGPLRPEVIAARASLGRWLRTQTTAILPAWLASVHARPPAHVQGTEVPAVNENVLRDVYDGVVIALEVGRYDDLEKSATALVERHLPVGYSLADLIRIVMLLKENLWLAITAAFDTETALQQVWGLDAAMTRLLTQVSLSFLTEKEAAMRDELEQTKWRLEKLDRTKSDFISIAAHELKTPLTLIQGYTDILNLELARDSNERRRSALIGLASGTQRLGAIIQDMIAVSMIDNDVLTLHYQPTTLQHIARMAVNDLEMSIPDRQITLTVEEFPPDLGTFYADPQRLYLVFNHIVGNSIKYTPDGGTVTIGARMLGRPNPTSLEFVQVSISDTGIGIARDDQERIFDKFYGVTEPLRHSSGRTKFKGGGPGLGLAVAKGIIDAHGGKIWVESPGNDEKCCPGSTFFFVLPVRREAPEPHRGQERLSQISNP
jgi:signal transduction histidine kinase